MARLWLALAAIAAVVVVIVILAGRGVPDAPQSREDDASADDDSESEDGAQAEDEPLTEEEKREAQEEKLVNAFDDLTDKWMEPSAKGVTMDKEIVETVYNDIVNRDEDVKKPILQQIFKDKSHPCWADTAWILDVTDELPKAKSPNCAVDSGCGIICAVSFCKHKNINFKILIS